MIVKALDVLFHGVYYKPLFLCIGSERHILDCFGPLIGTMLAERNPDVFIYGTLDKPLHAKNLVLQMARIKVRHPLTVDIAIDASVGNKEDLGFIKIKRGALVPGKATAKRLPPVGQIAITGTVGLRFDKKRFRSPKNESITDVYHMAKCISDAIYEWSRTRVEG